MLDIRPTVIFLEKNSEDLVARWRLQKLSKAVETLKGEHIVTGKAYGLYNFSQGVAEHRNITERGTGDGTQLSTLNPVPNLSEQSSPSR